MDRDRERGRLSDRAFTITGWNAEYRSDDRLDDAPAFSIARRAMSVGPPGRSIGQEDKPPPPPRQLKGVIVADSDSASPAERLERGRDEK